MTFPESGQIVVIDDNYDEINFLLKALSKKNAPYLYYDGELSGLPSTENPSVRFIFLDLELRSNMGQSGKRFSTPIISILKKILGSNKNPYFIFFWTKHTEEIGGLIAYLKKAMIPPLGYTNLEKLPPDTETPDTLYSITKKIEEKLIEIGAFDFFIEWENIIHRNTYNYINDFAKIIPEADSSKTWNINVENILGWLAKKRLGKPFGKDQVKALTSTSSLLSDGFINRVKKSFRNDMALKDNFKLKDNVEPELNIILEINKQLHYDISSGQKLFPGAIQILDKKNNVELQESFINLYKAGKEPKDYNICYAIITPACDIEQRKLLTRDNGDKKTYLHKIVYGIIDYTKDYNSQLKNKTNHIFEAGRIEYNGNETTICFHLGTVTSIWLPEDEVFFMSMNPELASDLQTKSANISNRLGNSLM